MRALVVWLLLTSAVYAQVKLVDQSHVLALTGGRVGEYTLNATWTRAIDGRPIAVAQRALVLRLEHAQPGDGDCSRALVLLADGTRVPATVETETGGPNCGTPGGEAITVRIARPDLLHLQGAKTLAFALCGTQLRGNRKWLTELRRLVARALADK